MYVLCTSFSATNFYMLLAQKTLRTCMKVGHLKVAATRILSVKYVYPHLQEIIVWHYRWALSLRHGVGCKISLKSVVYCDNNCCVGFIKTSLQGNFMHLKTVSGGTNTLTGSSVQVVACIDVTTF